MSHTLATLRTFTLELLAENSTDKGLVDATPGQSLDTWLNFANRNVWKEAVQANSDLFTTRSADQLLDPATGYVTYASIAAAGLKKINFFEVKVGATYYPIWPLQNPQDRSQVEPSSGIPYSTPGGPLPYGLYVENERVYASPPPLSPITFRVSYVPQVAAMAAAGDVPLAGRLPDHHDLVGVEAACLIYRKTEKRVTPWDDKYKTLLQLMKDDLRRTQGARTRRIRADGPY